MTRRLDPGALEGITLQNTYEVKKLAGEGGNAYVYCARHRTLENEVAIKVLKSTGSRNHDSHQRLMREARIQFRIQHPNIVRVLDVLEEGELICIVQEWCNGGDLKQYIHERQDKRFAPDLIRPLLPLLDGLALAHKKGYVHRDIKPQNILLHHEEGQLQWKLNDFGLVKATGIESITHSGTIMGSLQYIAPEQLEESKRVNSQADIYSMGVVLYELCTGRLPFTWKPPRLLVQIMDHNPPIPKEAPASWHPLLYQCLEKEPTKRPSSCQELKEAIQSLLHDNEHSIPLVPTSPKQTHSLFTEDASTSNQKPPTKTTSRSTDTNETTKSGNEEPVQPKSTTDTQVQKVDPQGPKLTSSRPFRRSTVGFLGFVMLGVVIFFAQKLLRIPAQKRAEVEQKSAQQASSQSKRALFYRANFAIMKQLTHNTWLWGDIRYALRNSCKKGSAIHCFWYGKWLLETKELLKQNCTQNRIEAVCEVYKHVLNKGYTRKRFMRSALPWFEKGCKLRYDKACWTLYRLSKQEQKLLQKLKHPPRTYLQKACTYGHAKSCWLLGQQLSKSLKNNAREKRRLFRKACLLGQGKACLDYLKTQQRLVPRWKQLKKHRNEAEKILHFGCKLFEQEACFALGELQDEK